MKKINLIIIILALFAFTYSSLAQTQTNTFPPNGYAGIGTLNPVGNFDIYNETNTATTPLISIRSNFHVAGYYGMIRFGDYTQTTNYQKGAIIYESVAGSARGKLHIALENTEGKGSVSIADAKLTVLPNGYVGIGITNPQNILDVNGTIHSRRVVVDLNGWADYVFKDDYILRPLKEVKSYISQNRHLPDMPSEVEIAKTGLDLGEMNKLLVKKVEELTLYLIEKDKELKDQQCEINQLKKETELNKQQQKEIDQMKIQLKKILGSK